MPNRVRLALSRTLGGPTHLVEVDPRCVLWARSGALQLEGTLSASDGLSLVDALEWELAAAGPGAWAVGFFAYEFAPALDPLVAVPTGDRVLPDAWWAVISRRTAMLGAAQPSPCRRTGPMEVSLDAATFMAGVETIRAGIAAGSYYQVNFTRRWQTRLAGDAAGLFAALCRPLPPRFAAFLEDREQGWSVLCLSPELFVSRRGNALATRPIKGTRPRTADVAAAQRELAASEKDAAELAMIVDLERNDLNRLSVPGSVHVRFPSRALVTADVVHREATVVGRLAPGIGWCEVLTALLPGGSVTGTPKLAACQAIAALEPVPRSVYCGALGVLRANGDGVLALPVRTGYAAGGSLWFHAGSGITWDSNPADEEAESRAKVRRWFEVLEV
jgi:anthranilate/para-aminobenzoate synthase component I